MKQWLPSLNGLRAFEAAGRHLSFSKAAEELHVTPAAISQQIKALEEQLGIKLFRRLNRALELTDHGSLLLPGVSAGFEQIAGAVYRVRAAGERNSVNVETSPGFASKWLLPRLEGFKARHRDIEVRISASMELVDLR